MESWDTLVSRWNSNAKSGKLIPKSSFIVAIIDQESYRSLRVPDAFHDDYSISFPYRLGIKCKRDLWRVKYDAKYRRIYGIHKLLSHLKIVPFDVLQLNYYGDGLFMLRVFKSTGNESSYSKLGQMDNLMGDSHALKNGLLHKNTVEFENNLSLLWFNVVGRVHSFYEMKIFGMSVQPNIVSLLLDEEMEPYYRNWKTGDRVNLKLSQLQWEVEVIRNNNGCHFGRGWLEFARNVNLKKGDTLVICKQKKGEEYTVHVCIFRDDEKDCDNPERPGLLWRRFFKIVQDIDLQLGNFVSS